MNAMSTYDREYTLEEIKKINRSVSLEKEDRMNRKLAINFNSPNGRKEINERTALIAKSLFKLNVTAIDIKLFRKCKSMEAKDRKLIRSSEIC
jgi:hypothetical protein